MRTRESTVYRCPICKGRGRVENPAFDQGFTASEWDEWGPEDQEDYLEGVYDVSCPCCGGERLVTRRRINEYRQMLENTREERAERRYFERAAEYELGMRGY